MLATRTLAGFADPVIEAQRVFRAAMMALARPGAIEALESDLAPPSPLTPELAALALALCDHETSVWLDAALAASAEVGGYLSFHTGARITTEPGNAAFALISDATRAPPFSDFAQGTDEYPDRSTTLVVAVERLVEGTGFVLRGPGIAEEARIKIDPTPPNFLRQLAENRISFPRGVDLIFTCPGKVAALPRSISVKEA